MLKQIRNNIISLLNEIKGANLPLAEVSTDPSLKPDAYPHAFVVGSSVEGDYQDQQYNEMRPAFEIYLFVDWNQITLAAAYDTMYDCIDAVCNKINSQESPSIAEANRLIDNNLPAEATLMNVWATPNQMMPDAVDKLLTSKITVKTRVLIDLTQL